MKKVYEVWFKDKNGNGMAYQGSDYKKAKQVEKEVKEDVGEAPYFVKEVKLLTFKV